MKISSLFKLPSTRKPKVCQICDKTFANGKAMGGHMRSHLAKFPLPPKHQSNPDSTSFGSPSSATSNDNSNSDEVVLIRSARRGKAIAVPKQDSNGKNENGSERNLSGKRSERQSRKVMVTTTTNVMEPSMLNSVSSSLTLSSSDEEVALCLLDLLKGKWAEGKNPNIKQIQDIESEEVEDEEEYEESDDDEDEEEFEDEDEDYEDEDDDSYFTVTRKKKTRSKYKCETCNQLFRSYQALGGHRASHKNKRLKILETDNDSDGRSMEHRGFPCPFCDKIFDSGQALGGHKKVHLSYLGISKTDPNISTKTSNKTLLDLNLPASEE